ncbi:MAG: hypothetical protein HYZ72_05690, partial [Deltaproteobacteria bacterium]|nr:hypothetical protein [Deltaproteobacteria bacterium]
MGSRFAKQVGTLAQCKSLFRVETTKLAEKALAACKKSNDPEGCGRQLIESDV